MYRHALILGIGLSLLGCSDGKNPTEPTLAPTVEAVAKALAIGLQSSAARTVLLDAMAESEHPEQKLILQRFVTSEPGKSFLSEIAEGTGTTLGELSQSIAAIPELDIYFPIALHRARWNGGPRILVGAPLPRHPSRVRAYRTDGAELILSRSPADENDFNVLMLHGSEPRTENTPHERYERQSAEFQLASFDPFKCSSTFPPTNENETLLKGFYAATLPEPWWEGAAELEFRSWADDGSGGLHRHRELYIDGIQPDVTYCFWYERLYYPGEPSSSIDIVVDVWEIDASSEQYVGQATAVEYSNDAWHELTGGDEGRLQIVW